MGSEKRHHPVSYTHLDVYKRQTILGHLERTQDELAFKLLPACPPEDWHFSQEFQDNVAAVHGRITQKDLDDTVGIWLTIPLGGEDLSLIHI